MLFEKAMSVSIAGSIKYTAYQQICGGIVVDRALPVKIVQSYQLFSIFCAPVLKIIQTLHLIDYCLTSHGQRASEGVSGSCLMPCKQFISHTMDKKSNQPNDEMIIYETNRLSYFSSTNSLQQQNTERHVVLPGTLSICRVVQFLLLLVKSACLVKQHRKYQIQFDSTWGPSFSRRSR